MYVMLRVVDESEGRDTSWLKSKILHHTFRRSEGQFTARWLALCLERLFQSCLKVMYVEVVVTMETDEIMLVAFMVAHEDVLAMYRAIVLPPALGFLDGLALGMFIASEGDAVLPEVVKYFVLSF